MKRPARPPRFIRAYGLLPLLVAALTGAVPRSSANAELLPVPRPGIDRLADGERGRLEAALATLDALLAPPETDPAAVAQAFGDAGALYLLFEFHQAAEACFANARTLQSARFDWTYYLAAVHERLGRLTAAAEGFAAAAERRPDDLPTRLRLGGLRLELGELDAAEAAFRAALAIDSANAAAFHGLGRVALARGQAANAIEQLNRALALQPQATVIHHQLGLAWRELGDLEKARSHLARNRHDRVHYADPLIDRLNSELRAASELIRTGLLARDRGSVTEALGAFREAVAVDPDNALAHYNVGRALVDLGDPASARTAFERTLAIDPGHRDAHVNLGLLLGRAGEVEQAETYLARAVALDPLDHAARRAWAVALVRLGRTDEARRALAAVIAAPGVEPAVLATAHADLGRLLERDGEADAAIGHFEAAVAQAPDDLDLRRALAGALGRAGRFDRAAAELDEVVAREPADVESRFGATMALLLAERYGEARARLEAGVAAHPDALALQHLLARVLATAPDAAVRDGVRALDLAREIFRTAPSIDHAETLAMAFAEVGDFGSAITWQERVITQAQRGERAGVAARAARRLERYRAGEPMRAPWRDG